MDNMIIKLLITTVVTVLFTLALYHWLPAAPNVWSGLLIAAIAMIVIRAYEKIFGLE